MQKCTVNSMTSLSKQRVVGLESIVTALLTCMIALFIFQFSIQWIPFDYIDDQSRFGLSREFFERLSPAVTLFGGLLGFLIHGGAKSSKTSLIPTVLLAAVVGSLASLHNLGFASTTNQWSSAFFGGFGSRVALLALILGALVSWGEDNKSLRFSNSLRQLIGSVSVVLLTIFYLPSSIVTSQSILHPDFSYVLNELLGPLVGHAPLGTSTPQYSSLLGWPLVALRVLPSNLIIEVSVLYVSLLFFVLLASLTAIVRGLFPSLPISCALLIPCSVLLARPNDVVSGSFIMFPSAIVRNVLPIAAFVVLFKLLVNETWRNSSLLGFMTAVATLNNLEFGLISAAAILLALLISVGYKVCQKQTFVVAFLTYITSISTISISLGSVSDVWDKYTFFSRSFGTGNNNIPMPIFGLHTLTLGITAVAALTGIIHLARMKTVVERLGINTEGSQAVFLVASGLAGLGMHLYYTGRSMVSTQLQTEFPIVIICSAGIIKYVLPGLFHSVMEHKEAITATLWRLPLFVIGFVPIASLVLLPSPTLEVSRLRGRLVESEFGSTKLSEPQIVLSDFAIFLRQATTNIHTQKVGLVAHSHGNALELFTGIKNVLPFNAMNDVTDISDESQSQVCDAIKDSGIQFLAIEKNDDSQGSFLFISSCPTVVPVPVFQSPFGALFRTSTVG